MLYPESQGKRLGLDEDIFSVKQLKNIPGTMTSSENQSLAFQCFTINRLNPVNAAFPEEQIGNAAFKMNLAAVFQDEGVSPATASRIGSGMGTAN